MATASVTGRTSRLDGFLRLAAARQDIVLVVLIMLAIFMIVLPLPTMLVDALIAINIGLAVLVLMVAIYLRRPVELSTLPAIVLLTTLFRLALTITTTRLILAQADAGRIIETFGSFVVAGNLVVGLVVFLIITIAQFVVITRGAERVAEVAARFSLDALPGKQMSIDSDMRSGEIDMAEARRRRQALQRESEFYGAMDGAMKFVKGDAIAGLVIICVNLLGGIAVGMLQQGLSFGQALDLYGLLTVGDGLVAQIPALMISVSAGTVVTRVADEDSTNLGSDIAGQLTGEPRSLLIAGLVLALFAAVPGFPAPIFLFLALLLGGIGGLLYLRARPQAGDEVASPGPAAATTAPRPVEREGDEVPLVPSAVVEVQLGHELRRTIDGRRFQDAARRARERLYDAYGVPFPAIRLAPAGTAPPTGFRLLIEGIPVLEGMLPPNRLCLLEGQADLPLMGLEGEVEPLPGVAEQATWVGERHAPMLDRAGVAYLDTLEALMHAVERELPRHVAQFVGVQETRALLAGMELRYPDLVKEAQKAVPLQRLADVLRRLVEEGVSVRNMRVVLEALVEWGQKEKDVVLLTEYVRGALKRQISHRFASPQRVIAAYLLQPAAEDTIRKSTRKTAVGDYLALEPDFADQLATRLREVVGDPAAHDGTPVLLTAMDVRRVVRQFLLANELNIPVLAHTEVAPEFMVQPLATVGL